jgi:hypothetical protein
MISPGSRCKDLSDLLEHSKLDMLQSLRRTLLLKVLREKNLRATHD